MTLHFIQMITEAKRFPKEMILRKIHSWALIAKIYLEYQNMDFYQRMKTLIIFKKLKKKLKKNTKNRLAISTNQAVTSKSHPLISKKEMSRTITIIKVKPIYSPSWVTNPNTHPDTIWRSHIPTCTSTTPTKSTARRKSTIFTLLTTVECTNMRWTLPKPKIMKSWMFWTKVWSLCRISTKWTGLHRVTNLGSREIGRSLGTSTWLSRTDWIRNSAWTPKTVLNSNTSPSGTACRPRIWKMTSWTSPWAATKAGTPMKTRSATKAATSAAPPRTKTSASHRTSTLHASRARPRPSSCPSTWRKSKAISNMTNTKVTKTKTVSLSQIGFPL